MTYSFAKGFKKGLIQAVLAGAGISVTIIATNWPELYNTAIVDFLAQNLTQILGTMTIGGVLTIVVNYLKVTYGN